MRKEIREIRILKADRFVVDIRKDDGVDKIYFDPEIGVEIQYNSHKSKFIPIHNILEVEIQRESVEEYGDNNPI